MKLGLLYLAIIIFSGVLFSLSCQLEIPCDNCAEKNKPPIAKAGFDQVITLPIDSVLLDGRNSSDPDGKISGWLWKKIEGHASFNIVT